MNKPRLPEWVWRLLARSAGHRHYPLVVALIAFLATATFSFPFVAVLIPAVLIAPRRWLLLGLLTGLASGAGGALLSGIFHFFGHDVALAHFPQLVDTANWQTLSDWLDHYGLFAIAFVAGSPMPQTPVIFIYSLANPSLPGVFIAVALGKSVKYVGLAWLTARYPARFIGYR